MAARKKDAPKGAKPAEEVDAEFVESTPAAPVAEKARKTKAAKPAVEAEVVDAEPEEEVAEDV